MKITNITLIAAGVYLISTVGCRPETPGGLDAMDASASDSSEIDVAPTDAGLDAVGEGIVDSEVHAYKGLCEICTDDSECVDGTVCVSIEVASLKECHTACGTDEDCNGSECVVNNGRGYCDPDEPCYPRCEGDKPFLDIRTTTCVECLEDSSCYYEDQYCGDDGACTCIEKICNVNTRQCDDCQCGACCDDSDCESTEVCWNHSCVDADVPCNNQCSGLGMMCYVGGASPYCVDCLTDSDCAEDCTCSGDPLWACKNGDGSSCL